MDKPARIFDKPLRIACIVLILAFGIAVALNLERFGTPGKQQVTPAVPTVVVRTP